MNRYRVLSRVAPRQLVRWTLVPGGATVALAIALPGIAQAATGTVRTGGAPLTVRASPSTSSTGWSSVANGASVTILCQTTGTEVSGPYGTSKIWDMLATGGFVSDTYVYTGSDGMVEHACRYAGRPPRANPRSADSAISWAFGRLGSTSSEGRCMRFTAQAYGWSASGFASAEAGGDYMDSHRLVKSGVPPRGALVWYHNPSGTGHVMISLGEGRVIGTSVRGRVGVAHHTYHSSYRGWSVPYYPAGS